MNKLTKWLSTATRRRQFAQEQLIITVAEQIWSAMEEARVSKAELASVLGASKSHITQLLSGSRNMTLRSLADIGTALGRKVEFQFRDGHEVESWHALNDARLVQFTPNYLLAAGSIEDISGGTQKGSFAEAA
jgi:transcriptional regulator with XRE-family HTH domain